MEKKKFPWGRVFLVGFGFLGISVLWPLFDTWVPLILQAGNYEFSQKIIEQGTKLPTIQGFGLAPSLAMFIMTWDNIINIFMQPLVGARSDKTWNKIGRRKPWILFGLPIALLGFLSIPMAKTVLAVAVFIFITNFGMALFRSPVIAWLGDLFLPAERSRANGVINMMGGVGGILAYVAGGVIFTKFGRNGPFFAGAIALVVAMVVVLLFVKEHKDRVETSDEKETIKGLIPNIKMLFASKSKSGIFMLLSILFWFIGFNAVTTGLSSFAVFNVGLTPGTASIIASVAQISFMAFAIPAGMIAEKLGRRKTILIGLAFLAPIFLLCFFLQFTIVVFILAMVVIGFFWSWVNVNSLPLVYDHGTESQIGAFTGLYYFSSQIAAVVGPTVGGILVEKLGYNYAVLFPFGAFFLLCAFLTMLKVTDKAHEEKLKLQASS